MYMWIRSADQLLLELRRIERFTDEMGETYWHLEGLEISIKEVTSRRLLSFSFVFSDFSAFPAFVV
jgi:hypothetical protein